MKRKEFHGFSIYEDGTIISPYGKHIKPRLHNGRYEVRLSNIDGKRKNFVLSRLIYFVFNPFDIDDKNLCVTYKDGNKLNIHLDNLELVHRKDLIQGENHKSISYLTDEQITEIRNSYKGDMKPGANQHNKTSPSLNDLAKKYNTTKANIKMIVSGNSRNEDKYKLK